MLNVHSIWGTEDMNRLTLLKLHIRYTATTGTAKLGGTDGILSLQPSTGIRYHCFPQLIAIEIESVGPLRILMATCYRCRDVRDSANVQRHSLS